MMTLILKHCHFKARKPPILPYRYASYCKFIETSAQKAQCLAKIKILVLVWAKKVILSVLWITLWRTYAIIPLSYPNFVFFYDAMLF
jgi:hypothetical protein